MINTYYIDLQELLIPHLESYSIKDSEILKCDIANEIKKDPNFVIGLYLNSQIQNTNLLLNLSNLILEIQKMYNVTITRIFAP